MMYVVIYMVNDIEHALIKMIKVQMVYKFTFYSVCFGIILTTSHLQKSTGTTDQILHSVEHE